MNNAKISNLVNIANAFNQFFVSIGLQLAKKLLTNQIIVPRSTSFECNSSFPTDPDEIATIIRKLKNTAASMDHVSATVLKSVSNIISIPLSCIINTSFRTGVFPEALRRAIVSPIHQSKSKKASSNYRPVSVLSALSKVYKKHSITESINT